MKASKISIKVLPDKRRITIKGKLPLKLRITFKGRRKYYSTGFSVTENEWTKANSTTGELKYRKLRNDIALIETRASKVVECIDTFTFDKFENEFFAKPIKYKNLSSVFASEIEKLEQENRFGTASSYRSSISSLIKFKRRISFSDITPEFLYNYENWFTEKGGKLTTLGFYLRMLRAVINKAITENMFDIKAYPFGRNKYIIPTGKGAKRSLDKEHLKKIFQYMPEENNYFEKRSLDFWKFIYLANGINVMDIAFLKHSNIEAECIVFERRKTIRTSRSSPVKITIIRSQEINKIINEWGSKKQGEDEYIFKIIDKNDEAEVAWKKIKQFTAVTNDWMKKIGEKLGLPIPVTTYVARHSFSTMLLRSGAGIEFISESLGHTNISTTQSYLGGFDLETKKQRIKALLDFG